LDLLDNAIERSKRWMERSAALIDGVDFTASKRSRVAISLLHLSNEHHQGIHTLVQHGVIGSAFALLRPQFESFIRGAWFDQCASDDEISGFLEGKRRPKLDLLIAALEGTPAYAGSVLSEIMSSAGANFHDFTHGGVTQVKARITATEIRQAYDPAHICGLLDASVAIAYMASLAISTAAGTTELAGKLRDEIDWIKASKLRDNGDSRASPSNSPSPG
jgi:hypothetical protein